MGQIKHILRQLSVLVVALVTYTGALGLLEIRTLGIVTVNRAEASEVERNEDRSRNVLRNKVPFVGKEDFESYRPGSNVNGLRGGLGWMGAWIEPLDNSLDFKAGNGFFTTVLDPAQGRESVTTSWGGTAYDIGIERLLDSHTSGDIISFKIKSNDGSSSKDVGVFFNGNNAWYGWAVALEASTHNIRLFSSGDYTDLQSYQPNTYYNVDVQFDYDHSRARTRVNGGSWSTWVTSSTVNTAVTSMWLYVSDGGTGSVSIGWWDDIRFSNQHI